MSRYIDADAFIKIQKDMCEKYCTDTENYCEHCCIKRDVLEDLDDFADGENSFVDWKIQTADVVEVVRCRDCKWYGIDELKKDGSLDRRYKPSVCYLYREHHEESWYCADAERRTE